MNPIRYILRLAEILAGSPVHEELESLQSYAEAQRRTTMEVELERDRLIQQMTTLTVERDDLKRSMESLRSERDDLKQYRTNVEDERAAVRERRIVWANVARVGHVSEASLITPGTFALLDSPHTYGYADLLNVASVFGPVQKGIYDPEADHVLFAGAVTGKTGTSTNYLLRYDLAENRWYSEDMPALWEAGPSHDTNAINAPAREMYVSSKLRPNSLRRMNVDTGKWSSMSQPDSIGCVSSEPSAEFFPDREELLWLQGKRLGAWERASDSWRLISAQLSGLGSRCAIARYSAIARGVFLLGGADTTTAPAAVSHALYKYDADAKITRLQDTPASVRIFVNRAVVATDPTTGNLVVVQAILGPDLMDFTGRVELWEYAIDSDRWDKLDESTIPAIRGWWIENYPAAVVAVPIAKHGLIMFISLAGSKSAVFLYKPVGVRIAADSLPTHTAGSE